MNLNKFKTKKEVKTISSPKQNLVVGQQGISIDNATNFIPPPQEDL